MEVEKNQLAVHNSSEEQQLLYLDAKRFRMRSFRLFLCLEIIFIGLPLYIYGKSVNIDFEINLPSLISIIVVFAVIPFIFFTKSNVTPKIVFKEKYLEFPRFFFWIRKVNSDSISSLEELKTKRKDFGVLVGLRAGSIINYEASDFQDKEDFQSFKNGINRILELNEGVLNEKYLHIKSINWSQNLLLVSFLMGWLVTYLLLANFSQFSFYDSLGLGALTKSVLIGEETYRIAASFFLHLNNIHISMNIMSFALFGQFLLRVVDLYRFLCILLLSAFLASLLTLALSPYEAIIGASGGIMGVFGAYCCLRLFRYLPGSVSSSSNIWILFFIAVQVALEYFVEGIDSYTHAGGFLTGFVFMWFCIRHEKEHSVFQSSSIEKVAACVLTLGYLSGLLIFFSKVYGGV